MEDQITRSEIEISSTATFYFSLSDHAVFNGIAQMMATDEAASTAWVQ